MTWNTSAWNTAAWNAPGTYQVPDEDYTPSMGLEIEVVDVYTPSLAVGIEVLDEYTPTLGIDVLVLDSAIAYAVHDWANQVFVGGVDVSDAIEGAIRVNDEDNMAKVATLTWRAAPGAVDAAALTSARVVINHVRYLDADRSQSVVFPVYDGFVADPSVDMERGTITANCTDRLDQIMSALTNGQIRALLPTAVDTSLLGRAASGMEYYRQLLSRSLGGASVEVSPNGLRPVYQAASPYTPWTLDDVVGGQAAIEFERGAGGQGGVTVEMTHLRARLPVLRRAEAVVAWTYQGEMASGGVPYFPPTRDVIKAALDDIGEGWKLRHVNYTMVPNAAELVSAFVATLERRWVQERTVEMTLDVALEGQEIVTRERSRNVQLEVDKQAWVEDGLVIIDGEELDGREALAGKIDALVAGVATASIVQTYKSITTAFTHKVSARMLMDPMLKRGMLRGFATERITAEGHVSSIGYEMSGVEGWAYMDVVLSTVNGGNAGASAGSSDPPTAPDLPEADPDPATVYLPLGTQLVRIPISFSSLPAFPDWETDGWNVLMQDVPTDYVQAFAGAMSEGEDGLRSYDRPVAGLYVLSGLKSEVRRAEMKITLPEVPEALTDHQEQSVLVRYKVRLDENQLEIDQE